MMFALKQFHKKYHTWLLLVETIIISFGILVLSGLARVELSKGNELVNYYYTLNFDENLGVHYQHIIPIVLSLLEVVFIIIIIILKNMKNPIFAKKCTHVLLVFSFVVLAADIIIAIFFSNASFVLDNGQGMIINHTLSSFIIAALQALICVDINVWRSEFGLEKYYG